MTYRLDALTAPDCERARRWRNDDDVRLGLRTPYVLTEEQQADFYRDVVCDRNARHRYWAVRDDEDRMVAMAGLTDIAWENGHAEISLLVGPEHRGEGVGGASVALVLREAFERMRLLTVFGEVYAHNPATLFWAEMMDAYGGGGVTVPRRKWWGGKLHDAVVFWFTAGDWREHAA